MQILNAEEMRRVITRLAMQAAEAEKGTDFVLIGIRTRGVILARRMQAELARLEGVNVPVGILDISLYRDDLLDGCDAVFKGSEVDFDIEGKNVVLCDDVIFTGRTVRAAVSEVMQLGRPGRIRFLALVDRGHRELPFKADFTGKNVPTSGREGIAVRFSETDGEDAVYIYDKE